MVQMCLANKLYISSNLVLCSTKIIGCCLNTLALPQLKLCINSPKQNYNCNMAFLVMTAEQTLICSLTAVM